MSILSKKLSKPRESFANIAQKVIYAGSEQEIAQSAHLF